MVSIKDYTTKQINDLLKQNQSITMEGLLGQRYIANALTKGSHILYGYAGNGFASFLNGATITLYGNAQEACGDTMSAGTLCIHGHCGDALAYGMRGGHIYVEGNCGSRCGVHMKQFQHESVLIIGGCAKDFLGEYLSGGTILVLNKNDETNAVARFCGVGAHGGAIYARLQTALPGWQRVDAFALQSIHRLIDCFAQHFPCDPEKLKQSTFYEKKRQSTNPYEGLYTEN